MQASSTIPWLKYKTVSEVIPLFTARGREWMLKRRSGSLPPFQLEGNPLKRIKLREKCLSRGLPADIVDLYLSVEGVFVQGESLHSGLGKIHLTPLEKASWGWPDDRSDVNDPVWHRDIFFCFAESTYGDRIAFCSNPPNGKNGMVMLLDSECMNQLRSEDGEKYTSRVVVADNVAQWIARWATCDFNEFALAPADTWPVDIEAERAFLQDHIRLNPRIVWARERLARLPAT